MNLELPKAAEAVPEHPAHPLQRTTPMKASPELIVGLAVMALAVAGLGWLIPTGIVLPGGERSLLLSPDFWPRLLFWLLLAMGLCLCLAALRSNRPATPKADEGLQPMTWASFARGLLFVAGLFTYYWAIRWLGIVPASTLILIGAMRLGGQKRWLPLLLTAVLLPLATYLFFVHVAKIPMPLGMFEQWL